MAPFCHSVRAKGRAQVKPKYLGKQPQGSASPTSSGLLTFAGRGREGGSSANRTATEWTTRKHYEPGSNTQESQRKRTNSQKHTLLTLARGEVKQLSRLITNRDTGLQFKNLSLSKAQSAMASLLFRQTLEQELIPILYQLPQNTEKEGTIRTSSCKDTTLTPKASKDVTGKETGVCTSLLGSISAGWTASSCLAGSSTP